MIDIFITMWITFDKHIKIMYIIDVIRKDYPARGYEREIRKTRL